jgi:hypothetical protein
MNHLGLACAVALVGIFLVSLWGKAGRVRFRVFVATAGPLAILPRRWRAQAAGAVVAAETAVVAALGTGAVLALAGLNRTVLLAGFVGAAALLLVFTVAIGLMLRREERMPCHCFGAGDVPLGPAHVVRNVVLLALAVIGPLGGAGYAPAGVALAGAGGVLVAALAVRFDDLVDLFGSRDLAGHSR